MNQRTELRTLLRQQARQRKLEIKQTNSPYWGWGFLQAGLTLLPLITAFLFLLGVASHSGYLSVFKVDSSEFPLTFEQTLLTGAISLSLNLLPFIGFPIIAFGVACALWAIIVIAYQKWVKLFRKINSLCNLINEFLLKSRLIKWLQQYGIQPHESKRWVDIMDRALKLYVKGCVILCSCGVVFITASLSYEDGAGIARTKIEEMMNNQSSLANKISYASHPEGVLALRIVCNASLCAFWTKQNGTIYIRHEKIEKNSIPSTLPPQEQTDCIKTGPTRSSWSTTFTSTCTSNLSMTTPIFTPPLKNPPKP